MEFYAVRSLAKISAADVLVLPYWSDSPRGKKKAEFALNSKERLVQSWQEQVAAPIQLGDFTGKEGETLFVYTAAKQRVILLGLGEFEKVTVEKLRRAYSSLVKALLKKQVVQISLIIPEISSLSEEDKIRGMVEGLLLSNYRFSLYKTESIKKEPVVLIKRANLIGLRDEHLQLARKYALIAKNVYFARNVINGNAEEITPQTLCKIAQEMTKRHANVTLKVFDKKRLEKEKMGLLLAVGQGAVHDPAFIIMEYRGAPKSKERTVLIGKGITFDTGGLHLKSFGSMETMKADMSGAAVVLATLQTVVQMRLKLNVTVLIPTAENAIGSHSYKPGDIYKSYAGKTVEVGNTDAEGRLILADALAYAVKNLKATRIIDVATLTGAMEICLGHETIGLMSNHDALADALLRSGYETYERLWRLPLFEEYREQLNSEMADIRNIGGRPASPITAALFLKEFVEEVPWAHCDIAGVAFLADAKRYHPKHASGIGVRLLVDFFEKLAS